MLLLRREKMPCWCPTTLANSGSSLLATHSCHSFLISDSHFSSQAILKCLCWDLQSFFKMFYYKYRSQARRQNCHYFIISQAQQRFSAVGSNLVILNVITSSEDAVFKTIIPHLTCTMKQLHERSVTFKAFIESNLGELAKISSINSINLSLLHQFQLVLTVSAVSGRELLQVPSLGEKILGE